MKVTNVSQYTVLCVCVPVVAACMPSTEAWPALCCIHWRTPRDEEDRTGCRTSQLADQTVGGCCLHKHTQGRLCWITVVCWVINAWHSAWQYYNNDCCAFVTSKWNIPLLPQSRGCNTSRYCYWPFWSVRETYCKCRSHQVQDWKLQGSPPLCSATEKSAQDTYLVVLRFSCPLMDEYWTLMQRSLLRNTVGAVQRHSRLETSFDWHSRPLTSSSQLQPRSWVTVTSESDAGEGGVTSCGLLGRNCGTFSMSFRLPYVPLFGAGFNPNKSDTETNRRERETDQQKLVESSILGNNQQLMELF